MKKILVISLILIVSIAGIVADDEKAIVEEKTDEPATVTPSEPEETTVEEEIAITSALPPTPPLPVAKAAGAGAPAGVPKPWPPVPGGYPGFGYPGGYGDPRLYGPGGVRAGAGVGSPTFELNGFSGYGYNGAPNLRGNFGIPNPSADGKINGDIPKADSPVVGVGAADVDVANKIPNPIPNGPPGFGAYAGPGGFVGYGPGRPGFYPGFRGYINFIDINANNVIDVTHAGGFDGVVGAAGVDTPKADSAAVGVGVTDVDIANKISNPIPNGPPGFGAYAGPGGFVGYGPGGPGFYPGFRGFINPPDINAKNVSDVPNAVGFDGAGAGVGPGTVLIRGAPFFNGYGRGLVLGQPFLYGP